MIKKKLSQINYLQKSNSLRTNSMISIFMKNKKPSPSPSISINIKNSEKPKLSPNKTDYKKPHIFLRANTLSNQSKTNPNFRINRLSNQISIKKKKSYNIFRSNPLTKEIKKENILFNNKTEDIYTNSTNYYDTNQETEKYQRSNIMPIIRIKKGDFEISEEDKMFDQYLLKKKKKIKKEKAKIKIKIKPKKKKLIFYNSYELPLNKVYKKIPLIMNKIESTKKLKNSFSLLKYQNLLLDIGSKNLDWDSKNKLNNEFTHLRNITNKKYELLRNSVKAIENQEKKIIDNINKQQEYYKKNMRENNYYCMTIGMNFYSIPNLKFHRTITKLKQKKKSIL